MIRNRGWRLARPVLKVLPPCLHIPPPIPLRSRRPWALSDRRRAWPQVGPRAGPPLLSWLARIFAIPSRPSPGSPTPRRPPPPPKPLVRSASASGFGSENLTVRVEMREGEVRTQFSSDSPELRAAVATQWSGLSEGAPDRNYHFSAPVYTTTDGRPADAGADTTSSQQQPGSGQFEASPGRRTASTGIEPIENEARTPGATAEISPTSHLLRAIA